MMSQVDSAARCVVDPPGSAAMARGISAYQGHMDIRCGAPQTAGWIDYREALGDTDLLLGRAAAYYGGCPTPAARTAVTTLLLGVLASAVAAPLAAVLVTTGDGLSFDAGQVRLRLSDGGVDGIAVDSPSIAADPLAGTAATYASVIGEAVDVLRLSTRRSPGALWWETVERLSYAVFAMYQTRGETGRAPHEVAALLAAGPVELRRPVRWLRVPVRSAETGAVTDVPWRARRLCCLAYHTPRWQHHLCATCPRLTGDESVRRITADLAGQVGRSDTSS